MDNKTIKPVTFSDRRQESIYKKLLAIGPGPAAFFKDACRMWALVPLLEAHTHFIAHALREINSSICTIMLPLTYKPSEEAVKKKQVEKEKFFIILENYGIDQEGDFAKEWKSIIDSATHNLAHRNALGLHTPDDIAKLWERYHFILEFLLSKIEANYLKYIKTLDFLLSEVGTKGKVKTLQNNIPNTGVIYNYFFDKLSDPSWLSPLRKKGFFSSPPREIEYPDGGVRYPGWPQSDYLKKMAQIPAKQQEVLEICLSVKTNNLRARNDILEISLLLPVEMAVQIVESIEEVDDFLSPRSYGKLIAYLAQNGKVNEALSFARKVLTVIPDPRTPPEVDGDTWHHDPISKIREYDYQEIIEEDFPKLVEVAEIDAVKILLDLWETFTALKNPEDPTDAGRDYSEIWRPVIDVHKEKHMYGIREILITGIKDSCEQLISNHPDAIHDLISELESRSLTLFRRMKLHILRKFPTNVQKEIKAELLNKNEFEKKSQYTYEYFLLAQEQAAALSPRDIKTIKEMIEKGGNARDTSEKDARDFLLKWQARHLSPYKEVELLKELYEEVTSKVGEPPDPYPGARIETGTWGFKSGISEEELNTKKPEEIVDALIAFKPQPDSYDIPGITREGTSRALIPHIAKEPAKWSSVLSSFSTMDPTFVRSVFSAHREALKNNISFEWKPVIELGLEVLKKPIELPDQEPSGFYGDDPDWSWCRHTLVELIDDGLLSEHNKIPKKYRQDVWLIIETLAHDPNPTPEEAAQLIESNRDPLTAAINSTRGDAIDAAIQYGIWMKLFQKDAKNWSMEEEVPELVALLEEKLDTEKEQFLGIRAVIGQRLGNIAWLDEKWLENRLTTLFPGEAEKKIYYNAIWDAFILHNMAYKGFLSLLSKQYNQAVIEIVNEKQTREHLYNPNQGVVHHLLAYYCRGELEMDSQLLSLFYKISPIKYRAEMISKIGRDFKKNEIPQEVIDRAVSLAETRLTSISSLTDPYDEIQEFEEFSWWIASDCFDDKWALDIFNKMLQLGCDVEGEHLVIEKYTSLAKKYPLEVINNLILMVQNGKKEWGIATWEDELQATLQIVLQSNKPDAEQMAKELISVLIAKGYPKYISLLQ